LKIFDAPSILNSDSTFRNMHQRTDNVSFFQWTWVYSLWIIANVDPLLPLILNHSVSLWDLPSIELWHPSIGLICEPHRWYRRLHPRKLCRMRSSRLHRQRCIRVEPLLRYKHLPGFEAQVSCPVSTLRMNRQNISLNFVQRIFGWNCKRVVLGELEILACPWIEKTGLKFRTIR
jgi:hypothetical protein